MGIQARAHVEATHHVEWDENKERDENKDLIKMLDKTFLVHYLVSKDHRGKMFIKVQDVFLRQPGLVLPEQHMCFTSRHVRVGAEDA